MVIGLLIVAGVFIFFAVGGLGNGSGLLIGLAFFVFPCVIWMLSMMWRNNPPEPTVRQSRR
jgi:hypothetical protein